MKKELRIDNITTDERDKLIKAWKSAGFLDGCITSGGYSIPPLSGYHKGLYDTHVKNAVYEKFCTNTTICCLHLYNGFEVIGSSASRKPEDFRVDAGQHYALVDALTKLGEYVAYAEHEAKRS